MKRPLVIHVLSGLVNIIVCLIGIVVILYVHHWFGKADVVAVVFWTAPIAITLAVAGKGLTDTIVRMDNIFLRLPLTIVISAAISYVWVHFVYLFHGPWTHAFSFPVFYLWLISISAQLIFLDRMVSERGSLGALSIIVFPFTLLLSMLITYAVSTLWVLATRHEKETFLIPQEFNGTFRVVYGQKCGIDPRIEEEERILEIPGNGVLTITSQFKTGIVDHHYFLVDAEGNRTKLPELLNIDTVRRGVWLKGTGVLPGPMADGSLSTKSPLAIHYTDFIVFNRDSLKYDAAIQQPDVDSKTRAIVEPCIKQESAYKTAAYRRPIYYFRMR